MFSAGPTSLRAMLLRRLWLPMLLLMLGSAAASYLLARHYAEQVHDGWLWDSAMSLTTSLHYQDGAVRLDIAPATVRMFEWDTVDRIYSAIESSRDGLLLGEAVIPPPPTPPSSQRHFYDAVIDGEPVRAVRIVAPRPSPQADEVAITVAETRHKRSMLATQLLLSSIPLQLLILVLAGLVIWFAVGAGVRAANRAATRLARYDASHLQPVDVLDSPRELRALAHAFNDLIGRLSHAQDAQQRFIANAAHQLRTPLAALQVQLERTLRESDEAARREGLGRVSSGLVRLHHLTHQILMLNRAEAADQQMLAMTEVDLVQLSRQVLERYTDQAIASDVDLGYEGPNAPVYMHGDPQLLREALGNLIDNALCYGRRGGVVTLTLTPEPLRILVDDDGPGIPVEERGQVLERFHRRAGSPGEGCGLGLAIASEITQLHDGQLQLRRSPAGGVRVWLGFGGQSA